MKNLGKFVFGTIFQAVAIALVGFLSQKPLAALPLSPGDRIRILIPEGELFNGVYEVNLDGNIQIPYLEPIPVKGLEIFQVKQEITKNLVDRKYFQPKFLQVNVSILQWAAIQVNVSGAVFQGGAYPLIIARRRSAISNKISHRATILQIAISRRL